MKKYDFVKVIEAEDQDMARFLNAEGMVIGVDKGEYPVEVCLFNKVLQRLIVDEGNLYFKVSELEVIQC